MSALPIFKETSKIMKQTAIGTFFSKQKISPELYCPTRNSSNKKVIPVNATISSCKSSNFNTPFVLHFDGCSKGNPGPAGAGAVIYKDNVEYWSSCYTVGKHFTNNYAEYCGLLLGLRGAISHNITHLLVKGDSMLVIKQMRGEYKVQSDLLKQLINEAMDLTKHFSYIDFEHVYRDKNTRADELANFGLVECMKNTKQSTSSRIFE